MAHSHSSRRRSDLRRQALVTAAACLAVLAVVCLACWALVRKPKILILDDSASALDYATDAKLRMAIRAMEQPPTTFIVSQRAASVRFADEILVLDDGCMVGRGTHDELLKSCPVYQEIYYSQFPKEVTGNG